MNMRQTIAALIAGFLLAAPVGGLVSTASAQGDSLAAYDDALNRFKAVLAERRRQIDAKQPLPNLPGQAL